MDLLKVLRRKGFARNQKATVFQSLIGIYTNTALHPFLSKYRIQDFTPTHTQIVIILS